MPTTDHPLVLDLGHVRGSQWFYGTALTHTTGTTTGATGIAHAGVGDNYLNTETSNLYQCTTSGAPETAQWAYRCCIKGIQGIQGIQGPAGTSFTTGTGEPSDSDGNDGDTYLDLATLTFYVKVSGTWIEASEQPFHSQSVDLSASIQETRTQSFFDATAVSGTHACIHKVGNVVTIYLKRPDSTTNAYAYSNSTHNFGVMIPAGYRPAHEYEFTMRVNVGTAVETAVQAIGWGRVNADGEFGIGAIQKFGESTYTETATILGLEIAFTYVVGGADASN